MRRIPSARPAARPSGTPVPAERRPAAQPPQFAADGQGRSVAPLALSNLTRGPCPLGPSPGPSPRRDDCDGATTGYPVAKTLLPLRKRYTPSKPKIILLNPLKVTRGPQSHGCTSSRVYEETGNSRILGIWCKQYGICCRQYGICCRQYCSTQPAVKHFLTFDYSTTYA